MKDIESRSSHSSEPTYCGMCYEYFSHSKKTMKRLSCGHTFCNSCFSSYFSSLIEQQNRCDSIPCPEIGCDIVPKLREIKDIINRDCYLKYVRFNRAKMVAKDNQLVFCSKPDCQEVLNLDDFEGNLLTCQCGFKTCRLCKSAYHGSISCD